MAWTLTMLTCRLTDALMACGPAGAQATRGPQLDPNQAEKNLESIQLERKRARNATAIPLPKAPAPEISADTKPLLKLESISVVGATVISGEAIAATYRSYIGRTVSKAD